MWLRVPGSSLRIGRGKRSCTRLPKTAEKTWKVSRIASLALILLACPLPIDPTVLAENNYPATGGASGRQAETSTGAQPALSAETPEYPLVIRRTGKGQGTVTINPSGTLFRKGASVTLTALARADSTFTGWSGACSGSAQTCSIRVNSSTVVSASFSLKEFTITVSPPTNGIIYPPGPVRAAYGEKRTFQIIPLPGFRVAGVIVDKTSVGVVNSYTFERITSDHVIKALFMKE